SERFSRPPPWQRYYKLFALAAAGRRSDVERMRAETQQRGGNTIDSETAFADLLLGDKEPLVHLLTTREGQRRWYASVGLGCHPFLDPLWSDARFTDSMRKLGVEPCKLAREWPFVRH
ncbi:MAG TPA: hypothetical protein VD758_00820, partial [Gemmatimonadaceae bacterium]|nr:hypothetical protein [Gemmatimonadaceae bacterium]